jgi:SAM-dependent methyltransferase
MSTLPESEFDRFADEYRNQHATSISASGEAPEYFAQYKIADIAGVLKERGLANGPLRILDFGAGIGNSVPHFRKHFPDASITCVDVSRRSLELGEGRYGGMAKFVHFDGNELPFPDGEFDVILCACVLHHIDHADHATVLARIRKTLSPRGLFFVYEHNPLNPLTVRAVNDCPFDENAVLIKAPRMRATLKAAGFSKCETRYRIFFPHFLRKLRGMERYLRWCPLGAQYVTIVQR